MLFLHEGAASRRDNSPLPSLEHVEFQDLCGFWLDDRQMSVPSKGQQDSLASLQCHYKRLAAFLRWPRKSLHL